MAIPFEDPIPITIPGDPAVPSVSSAPNIPSNSLNPWESKWSSGLGYPSMSDRLSIGLNNWVTPRFFIRCIWDEKHFKARKLQKQDGCYYMKERTDRDVYIGALQIKEKIIVNPQPDGTFEVLLCKVLFNREPEETVIAIPYINFVRRNILPYLNKFRRNPDCPDRYIILAFCHELLEGDDAKFLQLPNGSGWHESAGKLIYASSELVISQLKQYY